MNERNIRDITAFIFMEDEPQKSDVILIPGTSQSAVTEKAAALYRAGFAPYVLPAGMYGGKRGSFAAEKIDNPRYAGEYATDFEYCRHILMENGVPEGAILREDRSANTMENAAFSARVLKEAGPSTPAGPSCPMQSTFPASRSSWCQRRPRASGRRTGSCTRRATGGS